MDEGMTNEPWLGRCHFIGDGTKPEPLIGVAAVWVRNRDGFDDTLRSHLASQDDGEPGTAGLRLLWAEDVMPATDWMTRHAREKEALELARRVHEGHVVEIGPLSSDGKPSLGPAKWLEIKEIKDIQPLDGQFGVSPKKTVPDALVAPLFEEQEPTEAEISSYGGTKEDVPPLKTYVIIDAAKVPDAKGLMERSGLPWRCLFKGDAARELSDVAPYLVELNVAADFTRVLLTHNTMLPADLVTAHLWHRKSGIFVRSRSDIDTLVAHFRRFTRMQDETGKWYYFRFWEPEYLLKQLENDDLAKGLLSFDDQGIVICPGDSSIHMIRKTGHDAIGSRAPVKLDFNAIELDLRGKWLDQIAGKIVATFPDQSLNFEKVRSRTEASVNRMQGYGYKSENHLIILASWEVFYGENFETKDPDGKLEEICRSSLPAIKKFNSFRKRMENLSPEFSETD